MYLFLDTEFLPAVKGQALVLLSLGICNYAGAEFYAELHPLELPARLDPFVKDQVLAQFGSGIGHQGSASSVATELVCWLDGLGESVLDVCYDFSTDFDLLENLLAASTRPVSTSLRPVHVGYLLGDCDAAEAADSRWANLAAERGLHRHHALADAHALMARFVQMHGY